MSLKLEEMRDFVTLRPSQISEIATQVGVSAQATPESNEQFARRVLVGAARAGRLSDLLDRTNLCKIINARG